MLKVSELFEVHRLNEVGMARAVGIADAFDELLRELGPICAQGREFSILKTKLEEACFFAKKAMALKEEYQEKA